GRTDYNVLGRHYHIELFADGSWILGQDNEKIKRNPDQSETLICMEKGLETLKPKAYDASKVEEFWDKQEAFWADVREIWQEIFDQQEMISLLDDEGLYMAQFDLAKQFEADNYRPEKARTAIR